MAVDPRAWLFVVSLGVHGALATAVGAVKAPVRRDPVAITVRTVRPRPQPARPAPTPTPTPTPTPAPVVAAPTPSRSAARPAPAQRSARVAPPAAAPPPSSAPASAPSGGGGGPDFGLTMGNGGGGLAVGPGGGGGGGEPQRPAPTRATRVAEAPSDGCSEEVQRARPVDIGQPEYPEEAREAAIEGRVRIEVTIDEQGRVSGARVLQSLGHGCDEAALAVARAARFEPATRCGRPARSTLTIGIRFTL